MFFFLYLGRIVNGEEVVCTRKRRNERERKINKKEQNKKRKKSDKWIKEIQKKWTVENKSFEL